MTRYESLKEDVLSEAAKWEGSDAGPVPVFLACINMEALDYRPLNYITLGYRELAILGDWLSRASNLYRDELESLYEVVVHGEEDNE